MSFFATKEAALDAIGRNDFGNDLLAEKLTYVSGAGTPSATDTTPEFIGQMYLNTSAGVWYKAVGVSAATDFKALNS